MRTDPGFRAVVWRHGGDAVARGAGDRRGRCACNRPAIARPSVEEPAIRTTQAARSPPTRRAETDTREAMCLMIESAAKANDLPLEFFARVIWQESRFQSDAVGPVTRSGQRAQGIAQFMPGTASERRLLDPFDPVQALPKSAEFLSELRQPVRQSRPCGGGLQCRAAAGAGMAGRHRLHAAGDAQLRLRHHRRHGRRLGEAGHQRQACRRARRPRPAAS